MTAMSAQFSTGKSARSETLLLTSQHSLCIGPAQPMSKVHGNQEPRQRQVSGTVINSSSDTQQPRNETSATSMYTSHLQTGNLPASSKAFTPGISAAHSV